MLWAFGTLDTIKDNEEGMRRHRNNRSVRPKVLYLEDESPQMHVNFNHKCMRAQ